MKRGRKTRWSLVEALMPVLLIGLAACQSSTDVADVLDPEPRTTDGGTQPSGRCTEGDDTRQG